MQQAKTDPGRPDRCAQRARYVPVDHPVDRLKSSYSQLVPINRAGRLRTRVGRPAGRPRDAFCLLSGFRLLFYFGIESNQGFLNP